jgi:hypothetical protein
MKVIHGYLNFHFLVYQFHSKNVIYPECPETAIILIESYFHASTLHSFILAAEFFVLLLAQSYPTSVQIVIKEVTNHSAGRKGLSPMGPFLQ